MKSILSTILFSALLFVACDSISPESALPQETPEESAKAFFEALGSSEFGKAMRLGSDHTNKQLSLFVTELKMLSPEEQKTKLEGFALQFQSINCQTENGKTTCKICCNKEGAEADVEMVQQEDKWFVNMSFGY